jgi:hypothetical protein
VILLLLRQTGARLSEIIEMTVGGYRNACHTGRAFVKNKGSRGREEKLIYFTEVIEEQLLSYVRTERAIHDPQDRKRIEQLHDTDPLFLTEDGEPYNRSAFYYHWKQLFEPAQRQFKKQERIKFSPHNIRHLRVSRGITNIKRYAQDDKGLEAELLDGFWRLMGWSSSRTMETYTHTLNKRKALLDIVREEEENQPVCPGVHYETLPPLTDDRWADEKTRMHASAIPVQEDDEFSWYEE